MFSFIHAKWLKTYILVLAASAIDLIGLSVLKPSFDSFFSFFLVFLLLIVTFLTVLFIIQSDFKKWAKTAHSILNDVDDGIIVKDEKGNFVYCNEAVAKLYCTTPQDMLGKSDYDFTQNKVQADLLQDNLVSFLHELLNDLHSWPITK